MLTLQQVRDEVTRQKILYEGTRLLGEIDRFKNLCICSGYMVNLDTVRDPIYEVMERAFPPDLIPVERVKG
jgi:hypothetical protein